LKAFNIRNMRVSHDALVLSPLLFFDWSWLVERMALLHP